MPLSSCPNQLHCWRYLLQLLLFSVFRAIIKIYYNNLNLKSYFDALFNKLHLAVEAEIICAGGHLQLDASNSYFKVLTTALDLLPKIGGIISSLASFAQELCKTNNIKQEAARIITSLAMNPQERQGIIKRTSVLVTLNQKQDLIEMNQDHETQTAKKGFIQQCKNFIIKDPDQSIYQSDLQVLVCIDGLKIIYAISKGKVQKCNNKEETILILSQVPNDYTSKDGSKIEPKDNKNKQKKCCIIYSMQSIKYQNPLLNNMHLLKQLSKATRLSLGKVIGYSIKLQELGYKILDLDIESIACLMISLD